MSLQKILENWSDYDNKKKKHLDAKDFACTEAWEVDYLVGRIREHYPRKTSQEIRNAIKSCCESQKPPRPREAFVKCVLGKLGLN